MPLPKTARIVIIGGGAAGVSTFYHREDVTQGNKESAHESGPN